MSRYSGYLLSFLMIATFVSIVRSVQILDIAECRTCFAALAPGCKEKMSSADSSSSAGAVAMKDCMCTKQYFSSFTACGTCSAKSMNSNAVPDQAALDGLKQSCTTVGLNVEQNALVSSGTSSSSGAPSPSSSVVGNGPNIGNSNNGRSEGNSNFSKYQQLLVMLSSMLIVYFY
ncbi:hypothetical protein K493DRAFT_307565 [Basidiobolus meristosporus CBS 931.73]|uniref:Uncharacterized protein n=1 Tax=Basidiobolus meristosporus CBS 931.73 TaxID=1314790 RepID=A0A1Y1XD48_9FUNG|nr:hypothetical protein K493DRAFT_307565 [Basidiobolus meristosporus CBS 931.73]|eukprot:ORX83637.1 hypothetical protein K493DRAFT_307565 [Basidiobolus meristosporus CBS 931.73]